jgi:hypothetical protein
MSQFVKYLMGFIGLFTLQLLFPVSILAHDVHYQVVTTQLTVLDNRIVLFSTVPKRLSMNQKTESERHTLVQEYLSKTFQISQESERCPVTLVTFTEQLKPAQTTFEAYFTCPKPVESLDSLMIEALFFADFLTNLDHFVTFIHQDEVYDLVFNSHNQNYPQTVSAALNTSATTSAILAATSSALTTGSTVVIPTAEHFSTVATQFFKLGIEHIWTGYDHILFLLMIVLLVRWPKKILLLVTSFTLAHSITLVLAGLQIVSLSVRIVEPMIALSIAYVAGRNVFLLRSGKMLEAVTERWWTTFGFGLIHGLGFAGSLMEIGIPQQYFVSALLVFNLGIEVGQLVLLILMIPVLLWIDKSKWRTGLLMTISIMVGILALVWFGQRVVG